MRVAHSCQLKFLKQPEKGAISFQFWYQGKDSRVWPSMLATQKECQQHNCQKIKPFLERKCKVLQTAFPLNIIGRSFFYGNNLVSLAPGFAPPCGAKLLSDQFSLGYFILFRHSFFYPSRGLLHPSKRMGSLYQSPHNALRSFFSYLSHWGPFAILVSKIRKGRPSILNLCKPALRRLLLSLIIYPHIKSNIIVLGVSSKIRRRYTKLQRSRQRSSGICLRISVRLLPHKSHSP